jgi:hypothetical protein
MKTIKLTLEIIESPEGVFTASINNIRGCVIQSDSEILAIEEVFKQAWLCLRVDKNNFLS